MHSKFLAGVMFVFAVVLVGVPSADKSTTFTTTVKTKSKSPNAWRAAATKAATKACTSGTYDAAKVKVNSRGVVTSYEWDCYQLVPTTTTAM